MSLMILLKLPTEAELEAAGVEAHTFLDAFNKRAVSSFIATVKNNGNYVDLDGWNVKKADWFHCVDA